MILTADRIITGDGRTVIDKGAIHIKNGKIDSVGSLDLLLLENPDDEILRHDGCTLMPGLIDMHTHIGYYYGLPDEYLYEEIPMLRAYYISKRMHDTLRAGVTTIRDMSSADNIGPILKKAAAKNFIECPRIITSLKGICMTGGHGWGMKGAIIEADGEWEIRKAVRKNIRDGADCIKILTSEAYRGEEFSQSEIEAAANEAHRLGKKVAAHAGYPPSIEMCIQAGCDTIEHGTNLTVKQALCMKANDQTWVPTIYVFNYVNNLVQQNSESGYNEHKSYLKDSVAAYEAHFMEIYATGVRVATGTDTDAANHPQASPVSEELSHMVRLGLTPLEAIACATKNGGEALGLNDSLGLIKEGYIADIIAIRGDSTTDITSLQNVEAVYQSGRQCKLK